jgi:hypothetical protein
VRAVIRIAILAAALTQGTATLGSEPLTCSTWNGIRTCSGTNGYISHEWDRGGMRFGDDNQGGKWTSWRWQDREITTVDRPPGWDGR